MYKSFTLEKKEEIIPKSLVVEYNDISEPFVVRPRTSVNFNATTTLTGIS
jgi:hypothetical protein